MDSDAPVLGSGKGPPAFSNGVAAAPSNGGAPHVRRLRTLKRKKEEKESSRNQVSKLPYVCFRFLKVQTELNYTQCF